MKNNLGQSTHEKNINRLSHLKIDSARYEIQPINFLIGYQENPGKCWVFERKLKNICNNFSYRPLFFCPERSGAESAEKLGI